MENNEPILVEETYNADRNTVWNALTQLNEMRQWYFETLPDFEPTVGFETQFTVKSDSRNFLHKWKVTEVVPLEKITYRWQYGRYDGTSFSEFKLTDKGDETKLTLTCTGIESFPSDIPEFTRESCMEGWNYFLKESLKEYLKYKE